MSNLRYRFLTLRSRIDCLKNGLTLEEAKKVISPDDLIGISIIVANKIKYCYASVILFKDNGLELTFKFNDTFNDKKFKSHCLLYYTNYSETWFILNDISLLDDDYVI